MTWSEARVWQDEWDDDPFAPAGDVSMREMVNAGIAELHLESGSLITHEMIAEWLGGPFPRITARGERDYWPMDAVRHDVLRRSGLLLLPANGVGYVVATDLQMVTYAERRGIHKAMRVLDHAGEVLRAARPERLDDHTRRLRDHLETEARETNRVLRQKRRAFTAAEKRWGETDVA